ncbi:hypothetical protein [Streptosporangium carneum]|uniref:Uncharacterized protein n=1 Tax=Streptosporangium carneum TaxID=47481 RepID=A0A9W6HYQ5_9ACTN|nr:hypothetical protein [Streptosporangium carneum]GLK07820.1 hypothetical protein GCM10017600_12250 [Streptosporangium carneum]
MSSTSYGSRAERAAGRLRDALTRQRIASHVTAGHGLALVSLWYGLVVWSNGDRFWWCDGWNEQLRRPRYASHRASEPDRAAQRIARRYAQLHALHSRPVPAQRPPA